MASGGICVQYGGICADREFEFCDEKVDGFDEPAYGFEERRFVKYIFLDFATLLFLFDVEISLV